MDTMIPPASRGDKSRPIKKSTLEICREIGLEKVEDFWLKPGDFGPDDFMCRAFPEFTPESRIHNGLADFDYDYVPQYLAAYELTYRHHYEMEDEWRALISDPDLRQYSYVDAAALRRCYPFWYTGEHDFEFFERVMLCIADDTYWMHNVREPWVSTGDNFVTTWICRWRRRLGRPVVHGVDDEPGWHALVWRDNWKAVRDDVAAANAQHYVIDDADLPYPHLEGRSNLHEDREDRIPPPRMEAFDEHDDDADDEDDDDDADEDEDAERDADGGDVSQAVLRRAQINSIDLAKRIRNYGTEREWLTRGNTMQAEIVAIADRLAKAAGWPDDDWDLRIKSPGNWSRATLRAARQIGNLAGGPWREYIEVKSGRPARLRGGWEFAFFD